MDYDQKKADNSMENEMLQLRAENSLLFYRPSVSCLVSYRQQKQVSFSNQAVLPSNIGTVIISTDDYVYGPTSYLKMSFGITNASGGNLTPLDVYGNHGSVLNLFKSAKLIHKSGQVLEEINDHLGLLMSIKRYYMFNSAEKVQLDTLLGISGGGATINNTFTHTLSAMIPLSLMFGVFSQHNQLIPPCLLSGARIEVGFNTNPGIFVTALNAGAQSISIPITNPINMSLLLDSCMIYDSAKKQINEEVVDVKASGLQFVYDTIFHTSGTVLTDGAVTNAAFNFDVQQSNSIVKNVFFAFVDNDQLTGTTLGATTSKVPLYNIATSIQARLGSQYFPSNSMTLVPRTQAAAAGASGLAEDSSQAYENVLVAFESQNKQFGSYFRTNSISKNDYMSITDAAPAGGADVVGKLCVYGFLLDRGPSGTVAYSGVPTNSARLLNISGTATKSGGNDAHANSLFVWTTSTRVANCIGDSLILDR